MKKIVSLILAAVMLCSLCLAFGSCGKDDEETPSGTSSTVKIIDVALTTEQYAFAVAKGNTELLTKLNTFLAGIKANGEFQKVLDKYFASGTPTGVTSAAKDESKEQLVVATNAAFKPFEYKEGNLFYGIDMEIMKLFADYLKLELVIDDMNFESVCTAVAQGTCDVAASGLTIKPDRQEILDFSASYYDASQKIICLADNNIFADCKKTADMEKVLKEMKDGTKFGAQAGTTGYYYIEGDESFGFDGYSNLECKSYDNGAMAVQDLINGNIDYVIIDDAPATNIVKSING